MHLNTQTFATGLMLSYDILLSSGNKLMPFGRFEYTNTSGGTINQSMYYADPGPDSLNYDLAIGTVPVNAGLAGIGFNYETKWGTHFEMAWSNAFGSSSYHSNELNAMITIKF